jgi:hypothetical protein
MMQSMHADSGGVRHVLVGCCGFSLRTVPHSRKDAAMHAMLHCIKYHACTMLVDVHARLHYIACSASMLYVLQYDEAYMGQMHALYIAPLVPAWCVNTHERGGGVQPTSCIYMQYRDRVSMLECMVESQRNRLHKLVYIYMEVGHGVCRYNTYIMSHICT